MTLKLRQFLAVLVLLLAGACTDGPTSPHARAGEAGPSSTIALPPVGVTVCQFGGTYPNCWDEPNPPPPEPDPSCYNAWACNGGGSGGGSGGGGGGGGGTGDGGPAPADCTVASGCDPETYCDPTRDPECEKPLTAADTATINKALRDHVRPQSQFTDTAAARICAGMVNAFNTALASGKVFRGNTESAGTEQDPEHYGAYYAGRIHFDPDGLAAANAGNQAAQLEIAITALHEGAHTQNKSHPAGPTWDAQGRDSYVDPPFDRLNPGPNSCIPR